MTEQRLEPPGDDEQRRIVRAPLHPQAEEFATRQALDFANALILQAKLFAFRRGDDIVLTSHMREALDALDSERKRSRARELALIIGAAFFGAAVQGFITELAAGRTVLVAIYAILGFVGMLLVFGGLSR
jgi:hypothetical protein